MLGVRLRRPRDTAILPYTGGAPDLYHRGAEILSREDGQDRSRIPFFRRLLVQTRTRDGIYMVRVKCMTCGAMPNRGC